MQVVEPSRLATPGEAAGPPPPVVHGDVPAFMRVPAAGSDQGSRYREAFGRRLATVRTRRGVALEDIAQRMKVSTSLLAALERGDASRWPKGLFRRAFFRDYLLAIGLPAEPYVSEFLQLFPDGEEHPVAAAAPTAGDVPSLRLSLAAAVSSVPAQTIIRRESLALLPILLIAAVLTLASGGGVATFAAVVALCYYWRVFTAVTRPGARRWWRRP